MRRTVLLLSWVVALAPAVPACKKTQSGPTTVATQTANDGPAMVEVAFAYQAKGDREVELVLDMRAVGIEEMDKIVVQVEVGDFHLVDGNLRWTGFVPPRDPKKYRVRLRAVDGNDEPTLNVTVSRSHDSKLLLSESLAFRVDGGTVKAR
jgi:hypothetical protein